jgi:small subunit ribosomal protein S5
MEDKKTKDKVNGEAREGGLGHTKPAEAPAKVEAKDTKPAEAPKEAKKTETAKPIVGAKKFPPRKPGGFKKPGGFRRPGGRRRMPDRPKDDFEQKVLDLARVTRVMAGGKRMKFRATMVIGDKKGQVGIGVAKGADVSAAIQKAVAKARKNLIEVPILNGTVPHEIRINEHSAKLMVRPARKGSGIKAGGVMRVVFELAGIKDVVAKILGTNNKVNNAKATVKALSSFVPQAVAAAKAAKPKVVPKAVAPKFVKKFTPKPQRAPKKEAPKAEEVKKDKESK